MPSPLAAHLADRFAADARGLRARADAIAAVRARGAGPNAASYARMADACDRMGQLFAGAAEEAADDEALRGWVPRLDALAAGARSPDERNVYAGAVARLTEGLEGGDDDGEDDDEEDG